MPRETVMRAGAFFGCVIVVAYLAIVALSADGLPRLVFPSVFVLFLLGRYALTGRRPW